MYYFNPLPPLLPIVIKQKFPSLRETIPGLLGSAYAYRRNGRDWMAGGGARSNLCNLAVTLQLIPHDVNLKQEIFTQ